jgi:hypothetical protein
MADRFCGNCGSKLSDEDRFCRNCGRPVDETAHVPTPEADVPTPPPPPQGTPSRDPVPQPPQQDTLGGSPGQVRTRPFLYQSCLNTGCVVILIVVALLVLGSLIFWFAVFVAAGTQ